MNNKEKNTRNKTKRHALNFDTKHWKAILKAEPDVKTFLLMVLKDNHLTRLPVSVNSGERGSGSHRGIALGINPQHVHQFARPEYARVANYFRKRGFCHRKYFDWQWTILHEVTHAICGKKGQLLRQGRKQRIKRNPHGPLFCRILLRLARRYEGCAPAQELHHAI